VHLVGSITRTYHGAARSLERQIIFPSTGKEEKYENYILQKNMRILYYKKVKQTFYCFQIKIRMNFGNCYLKGIKQILFIECILLGNVLTCNIRFQFNIALNVTF